jgi:hypothetical protein
MQPNWHPDEVELDLYRTGEADPEVVDHIVGCDRCVARVERAHSLAELLRPELADIEVPTEQDLSLRRMARQAAARGARRRYWLAGAMAVAAAAAILLAVWRLGGDDPAPKHSRRVAVSPAGPQDLNRDGRVDILDAFALARSLERGGETRPEWDVNGDSVVDRRDVDAIAARIVSVSEADK